jgi:hypothetical protein
MPRKHKPYMDEHPWRRFIIFGPAGPTGWAMGITADHAIRRWLEDSAEREGFDVYRVSQAWVDVRWSYCQAQGYSVREVELAPVD